MRLLNKLRGDRAQQVELDDIGKALQSLEKLSCDFKIVEAGGRRVIVSSSVDFNSDQITLLGHAEKNGGWITFSDLKAKMPSFNNRERFDQAIGQLLMEGLGWEDEQPLY